MYADYPTRTLMSARLEFGTSVRVVERPQVFDFSRYAYSESSPNFDVSRDGQRFLVVRQLGGTRTADPVVVLNWFDEIRRRIREQGGR